MLIRTGVLVADDDPHSLDPVSETSTRLNTNVVRASSSPDLIEQLATAEPFDFVVADSSLPWMSGLSVKQPRENPRDRDASGVPDVDPG